MATLLLALFACGVSLLTLFSGFGLGTLLLPAFALFLPIDAAVAATAVVHAANNLFKVGLLAGDAEGSVVLRFGLPAVAASFAGALLLTSLSGQATLHDWEFLGRPAHITPIKLVMGLLILAFALFELVPALRTLRAAPRWLPLGGLLSGFFGGLSGHQGALRAVFLAPLGLSPTRFAATQAVLALLVDGARLLVYGAGFVLAGRAASAIPWPLVATVTLAAFAGAFVGKRLLPKVTLAGLQRLVGGLLLFAGAALALGIA
ncbi:MAG: TSUP family transporter [Deltaproteobacteria bacterium]|nr:TSUP family transporter [Deltaproteobacteria bacterium]MBW2359987.1 TSUP family transporter [Deltaproteobacteria bacterium]